jgi:hypothetical protein
MLNYIPRKLLEREQYYKYEEYLLSDKEAHKLYDLILQGEKNLVLLGDAGSGKSTELCAVAQQLVKKGIVDHVPVLIELNTYTNEDVVDYVATKIGKDSSQILQLEQSRLVFLFDEFDQVTNKEVATRKIKNFIKQYEKAVFVIACRTNFYSEQFDNYNFKIFNILLLDQEEISDYLKKVLGSESIYFLKQLQNTSFHELVRNPFFLKILVDIYNVDKIIPDNAGQVLERIIAISFEKDMARPSKYGFGDKYTFSEIESTLMRLALVMETLQRNFITLDELKKIIPNKEIREVVADELSLVRKSKKNGAVYEFQHNNFQEYLAAKLLSNEKFDTILNFITFRSVIERNWIKNIQSIFKYIDFSTYGFKLSKILATFLEKKKYRTIEKVIPSWMNTVAFLCQQAKDNTLFKYFLQYEPELTLKFESAWINDEIKEVIFKTIFKKITDNKIWLGRGVNENELARLATTSGKYVKGIYDYLMDYARSAEHYIYRYNAIRILGEMKGPERSPLKQLLLKYIKDETENSSVRNICFYSLVSLGMNTEDVLDELRYLKDSDNEFILSGLYHLITENGHADKYVDILIEGLPHLRIHSGRSFTLANAIWNLTKGIEKVASPGSVRKIIQYLSENPIDFREYYIGKSLDRIVDNMIVAYKSDPTIYEDVKKLILIAQEHHDREIISKLAKFVRTTNTSYNLFKEVYQDNIENNYDLLAVIADEPSMEFLIDENVKGKLNDNKFQILLNHLPLEMFNYWLPIVNRKTGKFIPGPKVDFKKQEKERLHREIQIILSRDEYLKEVQYIYNSSKKNALNSDDVHKIIFDNYEKAKFDKLVLNSLEDITSAIEKSNITFDDVKAKILKMDYDEFTYSRIFNLFNQGAEIDLTVDQINVIKAYCNKKIINFDFRTALKVNKNGTFTTSSLALCLWYFYRKFKLTYPENVLLDMLSYDWIEGREYVGIDYLEQKLTHDKIKKRILDNLCNGIEPASVLENHIKFCKKYRIMESFDYLCQIVEKSSISIDIRLLALETIETFPNSSSYLEKMLNSAELKLFVKSAEILMSRNNVVCVEQLLRTLKYPDENFAFEAARLLIERQNLIAILFYLKYIKKNKKFTLDIHRLNILASINNVKALPMLFVLLKTYYENGGEGGQDLFERLDNSIFTALKNIARQKYSNYLLVRKKMERFIKRHKSKFKQTEYVNYIYNEMEKDFFINYHYEITADQAIEKVFQLIRK